MFRRFAVLVLTFVAACAAGCAPREASPPQAATPPPVASIVPLPAFATTEALVARPEVRELVDELAATSRFASEHVSYDGHTSEEFKAFQRVRAVATEVEMIALLGHTSPVVRAYAAEHVIERDLESAALDVLLSDPTWVKTQYGCLGGAMPVSRVVAQSLCNARDKPLAARKLAELARRGPDELAVMASRCLTRP